MGEAGVARQRRLDLPWRKSEAARGGIGGTGVLVVVGAGEGEHPAEVEGGSLPAVPPLGEAAEGFAATLGATPHVVAGTLEAAVAAALDEAEEGEVVLLAPACASFDQFESFEERGRAFEALVRARTGG